MAFNETTIMTLFYQARLASITWKHELQTSEISSKAINYPFNKSLLVFTDFFTVINSSYINQTSVQSHTNYGFFKTDHGAFCATRYKITWFPAIRTHCLLVFREFNTRLRRNDCYRNLRWTREDSLPFRCYTEKSNNATICLQVS